jgi:DNA modification methylase
MTERADRIICGDALAVLRALPDGATQCCVTSPPYWALRDYKVAGQLGLERTPEEYVTRLVELFREVRRVLADDGTLWLNLGDSYNAYNGGGRSLFGALSDAEPGAPTVGDWLRPALSLS